MAARLVAMLVLALPFGCDQAPARAPKPETARVARLDAGTARWQGAAPTPGARLAAGLAPRGRSFA